jgi:hypothetical protein
MKGIILLILCSLVYITEATPWIRGETPWIIHIISTDSTVLVFIDEAEGVALYKINFDSAGKIILHKEKDSTMCSNIEREYSRYLKCRYSDICEPELDVYRKNDWAWTTSDSIDWHKIPLGLPVISVYHIANNGDVWLGGDCFLGYSRNGIFTIIFYVDSYESMNVDFCEADKDCPEEEPGYPDPTYVCFCDGRKIGYISDANGFVNFRTAPCISAPIIGIILDEVRVFYWDNEDKGDWYKVEINEVKGYVHKSGIKPEQNEELEKGE